MKRTRSLFGFLLLGIATPVQATDYYVDNCGHDASCNGQYGVCYSAGVSNCAKKTIGGAFAIPGLADGNVIHVAPGIYTGDGNRVLDFPRDIRLTCDGAPWTCVIDCEAGGSCTSGTNYRGIDFDHNDYALTRAAILEGFTITNCKRAILITQTSPTIRNCRFINNCGSSVGGAIATQKVANPLIENCLFLGNTGSDGGAIFLSRTGAFSGETSATIRNCIIGTVSQPNTSTNTTTGGGGGLYVEGPAEVIVSRTRFEGNTSIHEGGAIRVVNDGAILRMANCVIAKNSVVSNGDDGGGIAVIGTTNDGEEGFVEIMNSIIVGNTAARGGGVFGGAPGNEPSPTWRPVIQLVNSVLYGNTAATANGGHEFYLSTDTSAPVPAASLIQNSVIWKTAASGNSVIKSSGSLTIEESDVKDLSSLTGTGITLSDNIDGDPLFVDPDGADNVLGTRDDNLRIHNSPSVSPCKDAADETLRLADFADLDTDSDLGEATPLDWDMFTRVVGAEVDMGAYEIDECDDEDDCGENDDPCDGDEACENAHCVVHLTDCNLNEIDDFCDITDGPSADCNANGVPDECDTPPIKIALTGSTPVDELSLWRDQKNIVRLTFACDIAAPSTGNVMIQELLEGGAFGSSLHSGFTFTVENDINGNPRILRIHETASTLAHRTWYAVRHSGAWTGMGDFEVDLVVQRGDGNGDKFVTPADVSWINAQIPCITNCGDDRRADINGDGLILSADVLIANSYTGSGVVPKPSGH